MDEKFIKKLNALPKALNESSKLTNLAKKASATTTRRGGSGSARKMEGSSVGAPFHSRTLERGGAVSIHALGESLARFSTAFQGSASLPRLENRACVRKRAGEDYWGLSVKAPCRQGRPWTHSSGRCEKPYAFFAERPSPWTILSALPVALRKGAPPHDRVLVCDLDAYAFCMDR